MKIPAVVPTLPLMVQASKVPAEYRPLHQYLHDRYADTVVLSFTQIESLLNAPLPAAAHADGWWTSGAAPGSAPAHSRSWTEAGRTARANLLARNVVFERVTPERTPVR